MPPTYYEKVILDLPNKTDLEALYRLANSCLDSRVFFQAVKLASRLPRALRRSAYAMLERVADGLRRKGRVRDTRWHEWDWYYAARNVYQSGAAGGPNAL